MMRTSPRLLLLIPPDDLAAVPPGCLSKTANFGMPMRFLCNSPLVSAAPLVCTVMALLVLSGCEDQDQITAYTVPREAELAPVREAAETGPPTDRMLAAMVPVGDQFWFFKAVGPLDVMDEQRKPFEQFVQSITFEGGKPKWTLPETWREKGTPGESGALRYATIEFGPSSDPVELTVIPLPAVSNDPEDYVLANVNRWRGQLQLPDLRRNELAAETAAISLDGATATLVDMAGRMQSNSSMRAPFAGGGRGGPMAGQGTARERPATSGPAAPSAAAVEYDTPEGWKPGRTGPFRDIAFEVTHDGQKAELTVSSLAGTGGGTLANVNRWRGQIGLPAWSQAELDEGLQKVTVDGHMGQRVELVGEANADKPGLGILAVLVPIGDRTWFIKFMGDADVIREEQAHFDEFVASMRFGGTQGDAE